VPIGEFPLPEGRAASLVVRGAELVPPAPTMTLDPGDHVTRFARREDLALQQLMFGRAEGDDDA
jgi:Trk K+ transport system NAD-binding subunit